MQRARRAVLGLRYGTVELVDHSPAWAAEFREESGRLRETLAGLPCEIEHVGSTAVPGLIAKPIIDIAVGFAGVIPLDQAVAAMEAIGYEYRGNAGADGGHIFVRESSPLVRTHHVHVVSRDDPEWPRYLLFRDLLRSSEKAREAYTREKRVLAVRHAANRKRYTVGKNAIVERLLAGARSAPS